MDNKYKYKNNSQKELDLEIKQKIEKFVQNIPLVSKSNNKTKLDTQIDKAIVEKLYETEDSPFKDENKSKQPDETTLINILNAYFTIYLGDPNVIQDLQEKIKLKNEGKLNDLYGNQMRPPSFYAAIKKNEKLEEIIDNIIVNVSNFRVFGGGQVGGSIKVQSLLKNSLTRKKLQRKNMKGLRSTKSNKGKRRISKEKNKKKSKNRRSRSQSGSGSKNSSRTKKKKNSS